jgi:hypothetical protein
MTACFNNLLGTSTPVVRVHVLLSAPVDRF